MEYVSTPRAPTSKAPVSQAVVMAGLVFTAGIVGVDPKTGVLESGIDAQVARALTNLRAVLQAAGSRLDRVGKVTIYLADVADYDVVNKHYLRFFPEPWPARSVVQGKLAHSGILVEIEAVAQIGGHRDNDGI